METNGILTIGKISELVEKAGLNANKEEIEVTYIRDGEENTIKLKLK